METTEKVSLATLDVISKKESLKIWGIEEKEKENKFYQNRDLDNLNGKNYIAYINGLSVLQQLRKTEDQKDLGFRYNSFWAQTGNKEIAKMKSAPGYYLFKIMNKNCGPSSGWREAEIHEASELIQTVYKVTGERLLKREMHVAKENTTRKIILAVGAFQKEKGLKLFLGPKKKLTYKKVKIMIKEF
jgi:hypothetical protein